ncbi:BTAD domain-containing putative transcriptional regulator [Ideonella sp. DXS29W]|uniref:BTAD domain-containing putative transcriptional regulator n=1 Tax=Ideonella lacteola TaxID=2984193 RepID=A0ABU9BJ05_9BURK
MNENRGADRVVHVELLGPPRWRIGEAHGPLERKWAAALLLAATQTGGSRERVAQWLWPDSGEAARSNLRVLLHRMKAAAGGVNLLSDTGGWSLAEQVEADISALQLEGEHPRVDDAVAVLTKPLLFGCDYDDLPKLQSLVRDCSADLLRRAIRVALHQAESALRSGQPAELVQARGLLQRVLHEEPLDEPTHRLLMRVLVAQGERSAALAIYERLRLALEKDLGTSPDRQTRQLHIEILQENASPALTAPGPAGARLRTERLIGRGGLIEQLAKAARGGRHLWLQGEAGIGKTRVLEGLLSTVHGIHVACRMNDDSRPYAVLKRLLAPFSASISNDLDPSMSSLLQPLDSSSVDIHDVLEAVTQLLWRLKRDGVWVVAIEDVHNIDDASARVLIDLCEWLDTEENGHDLPALLLIARRQHDNPACTRLNQATMSLQGFDVVDIAPLDEAATTDLALELARQPPFRWLAEPRLAAELHRMGGGNPFFMLEIVRAAQEAETPELQQVRVRRVEELLGQRLRRASAPAQELCGLLAVAQHDFDPGMPGPLLMQDPPQLLASWRELMQLGLLGDTGFSHDLAREAARAQLVPPQAQLFHLKVAEFLERQQAASERIAFHYLNSHLPQRATEHVLRAMRKLTRDGLLDAALSLGQRASERIAHIGESDEGFELLWRLHAARVAHHVHDASRLVADLQTLTLHQRTSEQALITAVMRLRTDNRSESWPELQLSVRQLLDEPPLWPWWHALAVAYGQRAHHSDRPPADLRALALRVATDIRDREDGYSAAARETGMHRDCSHLLWELGEVEPAHQISQGWLASLGPRPSLLERDQALTTVGWMLAGAGRYVESLQVQKERLAYASRRGQSRSRERTLATLMSFRQTQLGLVADALATLERYASDPQDRFSVQPGLEYIPMQLLHALGDETGSARWRERILHRGDTSVPTELQGFCLMSVAWRDRAGGVVDLALLRPYLKDFAPEYERIVTFLACDSLRPDEAWRLAQAREQETLARGELGEASGARTEMARTLCRLDRWAEARLLIDQVLAWSPRHLAANVTAADQARRLWQAMCQCQHAARSDYRQQWARWRDEQAKQLPMAWRERFVRRHGWVDDQSDSAITALTA